ncbi:hypothetical protein FN846DRAFT_1021655 [Sphaerosporella brunnea]|uniref:HNH nuclease domain-containing protein n=1 Tax=Sphaerosporella brunnea TaxID=1250544 RepID=A0A5J5EW32_9PEZI|nr:hypothetical protein FN846DRAFT_1021655 [Sphaerosporella brunnea]
MASADATSPAAQAPNPSSDRYAHFWGGRNVTIQSLPDPLTGEIESCGFCQQVTHSFQITFGVLFEMLAAVYQLEPNKEALGIRYVLAQRENDSRATALYTKECTDAVPAGAYWFCEYRDGIGGQQVEWQNGKAAQVVLLEEVIAGSSCCMRGDGLRRSSLECEDTHPERRISTFGGQIVGPQARFRWLVTQRDPRCILTHSNGLPDFGIAAAQPRWAGPGIDAVHIVPVCRPDQWSRSLRAAISRQRLLQRTGDQAALITQNCAENGIMLRSDMRCMFDYFFWSVHPKTLTVVVFVDVPELHAFHGKKLTPETLIGFPPREVWEWHWNQAVVRSLKKRAERDNKPEPADGVNLATSAPANPAMGVPAPDPNANDANPNPHGN